MPSPNPTLEEVTQALIMKAVGDVNAGVAGYVGAVLAAYGQSISTEQSVDDPEEYLGLIFDEPGDIPAGVSVAFIPLPIEQEQVYAPPGNEAYYDVLIRIFYTDTDPEQPAEKLSRQRGRKARMMTRLAQAFMDLYSATSLGAERGGWQVGGGTVLNPIIEYADPTGTAIKRHQRSIMVELLFSGFVEFVP